MGLLFNPPTAICSVEPYLDQIDLLLVMTVNPGFGGQEFIREGLPKIQAAAWRHDKALSYSISVDGGITNETGADAPGPAQTPSWRAQVCLAPRTSNPLLPNCDKSMSEAIPH